MTDATSEINAAVNGPVKVTLYDRNGKAVEVLNSDAAYWLAQGFALAPASPQDAWREVKVLLGAVERAVGRYVEGVQMDGFIDRSDESAQVAAEVAFGQLAQAWDVLRRAIYAKFPPREAEPIVMLAPVTEDVNMPEADGAARIVKVQRKNEVGELLFQEVMVDPSQVAYHQAQGWKLKEA